VFGDSNCGCMGGSAFWAAELVRNVVGKHDSGWSKFVTVSEFPRLPLMCKSCQLCLV
jgi:hypothetical protein